MPSPTPPSSSKRTPVTLGDPANPIACEFLLDRTDTDPRGVLIVRFVGTYRIGSRGGPDAAFMEAMVRAGEIRWHPAAVVLDLSALSYKWGDEMEMLFGRNCPHGVEVRAVVVGPDSRLAVGTLLFGVKSDSPATAEEGFFDDLDAAVAYVRNRIGPPAFEVTPRPKVEPMTEAEWLSSRNPVRMWMWVVYDTPDPHAWVGDLLRADRASDRKLLLFSAACCRRIWHLMDPRSRGTVEAVEAAADTGSPLPGPDDPAPPGAHAAYLDALDRHDGSLDRPGAPESVALAAATAAVWVHSPLHGPTVAAEACDAAAGTSPADAEEAAQADLLRDVFGNPFRPLPDATHWRSDEALALAREIDATRSFDRTPDLAAALERAGCDDAAALGHCRLPNGHTKGCWVIDLLLGRS